MSVKRFVLAAAAAGVLGVASAAPAAAHVTAQPGQATKGDYTVITFRVPNESDTAGTVKLEVTLPAQHPIASVRTKPVAGWTAQLSTVPLNPPVRSGHSELTEAVRTITWTAQPGVRIGPSEFDEFEVSAGPLPSDTDRLVMPAVQTYDDGQVVRWDAPPPAEGAAEPEHPAPVLELVDEDAGPGTARTGTQPGVQATASSAPDTTARWLGGSGLLLGALGLGVGTGAVLRSRRPSR